ncbi:unnamed protein product [Peronospora belbahrii]|uniref:HRDC domain-containing protein n=1 Tax=Peronospora belbahrii TaxID=622444 RepID=A0AAU9KTT8_9STRA|nr:unnamed protein product [Peronospora belbahrii]CAH0519917.1 unnamed protein product [Peronospora belbahrii]
MRVKKLNVNRRHKPGEDEAAIGIAAGGDSEQRRWVSPTKFLQEGVASGSNSGSSSPTDVQQQQHLDTRLPLQFQTNNTGLELYVGGAGGIVAVMPNATVADVDMHGDKIDENPIRTAMVSRIVEMLQAMKPNAPEKVLAALPRLAQHMEKTLFKLAKNEAEYCNPATLRQRIVHIQESNAKRLLAQQQQQQQTSEEKSTGNEAMSTLKAVTEEQACIVFHHLQSWRQKLVNMYGVAPWDILPNSMLAKVALYMPCTEQELAMCGVENDKIVRFGSSLMQKLQHLRGRSKRINSVKTIQGRKPSLGKRGSRESLASGSSNKKPKNGKIARLIPTASSLSSSLLMSPPPLFPSADSLPTLLPTVSMMPGGGVSTFATATGNSMVMKQSSFSSVARLSPAQTSQQPFFSRLQPQQQQQRQQGSSSPVQENHMHLLVEGAGQLSKEQNAKSVEAYEQEVQSLRWMLHQSQQEKLRLEQEVQRLQSELHGSHMNK